MANSVKELAQDIQEVLKLNSSLDRVYEGEAPTRSMGGAPVKMPYLVYTADVNSPLTESGIYTVDLIIDFWVLDSWETAYDAANRMDYGLDGLIYTGEAGTLLFDQNGPIMQRMERDPDDSRIRRMRSQYLIRFYPEN